MAFPKLSINTPDILIVSGLIMDAVGIVLLFCFAPEKFPDPQTKAFFKIEDESRDEWGRGQSKRNRIAKFSVFIIVLGFMLQCIAVMFW